MSASSPWISVLVGCVLWAAVDAVAQAPDDLIATSPDGRIVFELDRVDGGRWIYTVTHDGRPVVEPSALGFELQDRSLAADHELLGASWRDAVEEFELPWGEQRLVRDAYGEMVVELRHRATGVRTTVTVRVFDDGLGFRFTWPRQDALDEFTITDELTEFDLAGDPVAWWIPAYAGNRYEHLYRRHRLSALRAMDSVRAVHTPLTLEMDDGLVVALHEAALTDYASMTLDVRDDGVLECDLVPWSDGTKVKATAPFHSPWRVILIGEDPADLVESTLVLSLNEPSRIDDTSWITPGKYAGIWWSLHIGKETWTTGPTHGATTENAKALIDFAADNGFLGVLVEGWNTGWDDGWLDEGVFDHTTPTDDYDLEEVTRYAREKGVTIVGHLENGGDVSGFEARREIVFGLFRDLGIRAIKTGYVSHGQGISRYDAAGDEIAKEWQHGQYMVRHFRDTVEAAARHGIMVNVHEPIKDTGIRRTWPNMMTREGARGQEYNAWSQGNGPDHTVILPFTRMLSGPMDFTPGIVDVMIEPWKPNNRVPTTVAKQLALYVTIYSPLQMVTDLPENYAGEPAFGFIQDVAVDWDESRVLTAAVGDHFTIARKERGGDQWFLGSTTDENPRVFDVSLDFLDAGREYVAYVYADAADAHWETRPTTMSITRQRVTHDTVLRIELAAGGGQAIRFTPLD